MKKRHIDFEQAFLDAIADGLPEMRSELSKRVDAALEREIRASAPVPPRADVWRRRLLAVCGAAAVIGSIWFGVRLVMSPELKLQPEQLTAVQKTHGAALETNFAPDTIRIVDIQPVADRSPATARPDNAPARRAVTAPQVAGVPKAVDDAPVRAPLVAAGMSFDHSDDYLSVEEEKRLAQKYRVVTNAEEANEIISSVFNRMESNIAESEFRMSEIVDSYDAEIDKLN